MSDIAVVKNVQGHIDVALKLIDGSDLLSQTARQHLSESLKLLDTLLAVKEPSEWKLTFPVTVWFRKTKKNNWIQGKLNSDKTVEFDGVTYDSPSKAASTFAGHSLNGWSLIFYDDPETGLRTPIDNLRKKGLFPGQKPSGYGKAVSVQR